MYTKIHNQGSKPSTASGTTGFTLMEILIAFLILGVVVTTVLASFNMVFSTTEALDRKAAIFDAARTSLNRMVADLEQVHISRRPLYRPPQPNDPPDPYRIEGVTEDVGGTSFANLRFASRSHIPPRHPGDNRIAQIWYYVLPRNDGRLVLMRSDRLYPYPDLEKDAADAVLCEAVKSLAFTYIDMDGTETDSWNSDQDTFGFSTPTAVNIRLEVGDEKESAIFETSVRLPVVRTQSDAQ